MRISKQAGLSLIELMIALTLGLILTLGVIEIFLSSKRSYTVVTAQSETQENGRVVKHFLGRGLRHAGFWSDPTVPRFFPAQGVFQADQIFSATNNDSTDASVVDGTDTVTVRFNGAADQLLRGCTGMAPDASQVIVDRYYLRPAGGNTNVPSLMCQSQLLDFDGNVVSTDTQQLILGIEDFQVELGIGSADRIVRYVAPDAVTDWLDVRSVRYALIATSNNDTAGQANNTTYNLVTGESYTAPGDNRIRQVHRETVFLRNFRG